MDTQNFPLKWIVAAALAILLIVGYLIYFSGSEQTAVEEISESVPQILTNPVQNQVPELNPLEKVNPFQYENPLR